jgi:hypothetical protein
VRGRHRFLMLVFGTPMLVLTLVLIGLAFVVARSIAFLSGMFIAVGATWQLMLARASASCAEFDARPNSSCTAPDLGPLMIVSAFVLVAGLALGGWVLLRSRRVPTPT